MHTECIRRFIEALEGALAASWRIRHRRELGYTVADAEADAHEHRIWMLTANWLAARALDRVSET